MKNDIKLAVITGTNNEIDGQINCFQIGEDDAFHAAILSDYLKEKYWANEEIKKINLDNANAMGLFLREQGDVVFFNSTTYKDGSPNKHGRTGIFIIPDNMTENQIESLKELNEKVNHYDEFQIWFDFESHDQCKMLFTKNKEQVKTIIDNFIKTYSSDKKRR